MAYPDVFIHEGEGVSPIGPICPLPLVDEAPEGHQGLLERPLI